MEQSELKPVPTWDAGILSNSFTQGTQHWPPDIIVIRAKGDGGPVTSDVSSPRIASVPSAAGPWKF